MKANSNTSKVKLPKSNRIPQLMTYEQHEQQRKERVAKAKAEAEKISAIHSNEAGDSGSGIGFLETGTGVERLVEYCYDRNGKFHIEDISLSESAQWWEKMIWAEQRLGGGDRGEYDEEALMLWLRRVATELA